MTCGKRSRNPYFSVLVLECCKSLLAIHIHLKFVVEQSCQSIMTIFFILPLTRIPILFRHQLQIRIRKFSHPLIHCSCPCAHGLLILASLCVLSFKLILILFHQCSFDSPWWDCVPKWDFFLLLYHLYHRCRSFTMQLLS